MARTSATDQADYRKTAIRFFKALLDDLDRIGDGHGGDNAARRDNGYAIRNLGARAARKRSMVTLLASVCCFAHDVFTRLPAIPLAGLVDQLAHFMLLRSDHGRRPHPHVGSSELGVQRARERGDP